MNGWIFARVSTEDQDADNQVQDLKTWAEGRGIAVQGITAISQSGWTSDPSQYLKPVYDSARRGEIQVVFVWALDRLSRKGALATLDIVDRLGRLGVRVLSYQEPWTEAAGPMGEVLLALAGWVAQMESQRRSEQTRAGMRRAVLAGKSVGRPKGSSDKRPRVRRGYLLRYAR